MIKATRGGLVALIIASALSVSATAQAQTLALQGPSPVNDIVGTCNSADGCKTLRRACLKAKGDYNEVNNDDGPIGACKIETTDGAGVRATSTLAANTGPVRDAFCRGSFCKVLKQTCEVSGGTYQRLGSGAGVCRD